MRKSLIVIVLAILAVAYASIFIVPQTDRGIVLRLVRFCVILKTNRSFMSRVCISKYHLLKR